MYLPELISLSRLLSPSEKLELAQKLIQMAKINEPLIATNESPVKSKSYCADDVPEIEERLLKLHPGRPDKLINCIKTMYKLTGGISDGDIANAMKAMSKRGIVKVTKDSVTYSVDRTKSE